MKVSTTESLATGFRDVMAGVCTPVSVVTAMDASRPHGTTVSAFASLSMDPPMVLVSLDRGSDLLALVRETQIFGINILSHNQSDIALQFARKGEDKFDGVAWTLTNDVPRLDGVSSWLACRTSQLIDGGDHVIALGEIIDAVGTLSDPLTYHAREFGTHTTLEVQPR